MSFRDLYRHTSIERQFHEREESRDEKEEPFPDEQPSPDFCVDQINNALHDHKRERNFLKEKGLMEQANTMERYNTPRKRRTAFSNLNDEIVQFQKIVNDLHRATENDVKTPEEQWRLRILFKSAQDADAAISQRVEHCTWQKCDVAVRASFSKLKRDYERAHETYEKVTEIYLLKQSAEVSMLSSKQEETIHDTYSQRNHILVSQEEDFYDRTMREREQEAKKINDKLHVVNGIYEDLGRIVSEQQEKIDMVEDNLLHSSACAQGGLEQLKKKNRKNRRQGSAPQLTEEQISWTSPFLTLTDDIHEVGEDLVDLLHFGARGLKGLKNTKVFQCGPGEEEIATTTTDISYPSRRARSQKY